MVGAGSNPVFLSMLNTLVVVLSAFERTEGSNGSQSFLIEEGLAKMTPFEKRMLFDNIKVVVSGADNCSPYFKKYADFPSTTEFWLQKYSLLEEVTDSVLIDTLTNIVLPVAEGLDRIGVVVFSRLN